MWLETKINNTCRSDSLLNNQISIQNFSYENCIATSPLTINFINSGQASANCALDIITKLLVDASNQVASSQTTTNANTLIVFGLICLAGIAACVVVVYLLKDVFIMSPSDKIKLELAKKERPDILTRYKSNFYTDSLNTKDISKYQDLLKSSIFNKVKWIININIINWKMI